MNGLEKFKEYFADYSANYVVIGGAACGLYADIYAQTPRVTHDIDTVLVVEALTPDFGRKFWQFVKDAGYSCQETSQGKHEHFRFRRFLHHISMLQKTYRTLGCIVLF